MRSLPIAATLLLAACATIPPLAVAPAIVDSDLQPVVAMLASDALEGRMAGTAGEAKTIAFIAERFRAAGLESGSRGAKPYLDPFTVAAMPIPTTMIVSALGVSTVPAESSESPQGEFNARRAALGSFTSHNVVGVARGRHPDGKVVLLMAHWDHLGICAPEAADKICNGAVDNGSGVAAMLAVAERVAKLGLDRDVWFVATSAEEWGLLGAKAFADRPPLPLASIIAGFNLDMIAVASSGARVAMIAPPHSRLAPLVRQSAAALGRAWDGDREADSFLRRQDGWALAERGVPMVMVSGSFSDMKLLQSFIANRYHSPDDELRPHTDLGGAVDDANLHLEMIRRAASRKFVAPSPRVPQLTR
ncbi:MAG: M20/M25/M40 family metallo-hydrolase [Pseudomonadota bacterium]